MQHLEVSCAVRPIYGSLGAKGLKNFTLSSESLEILFSQSIKHNAHSIATCLLLINLQASYWNDQKKFQNTKHNTCN
jgi:hypothetical protein